MKQFVSLNAKDTPIGFTPEMFEGEPLVDLTEKDGQITLRYIFPGFYKTQRTVQADGSTLDFSAIKIKSAGYLSESGKPLLPSFGRYLNIPVNSDYTLRTETADPVEITGITVAPSQALVTDDDRKHDFEYDKKLYATDEYFPKDIVEVTGPFDIDDYQALLVHVRPIQYNPVQKKLICYNQVKLTFTFTPQSDKNKIHFLNDEETDQQVFGNLFLNPKKNIEERLNITADPGYVKAPGRMSLSYLLLFRQSYKQAADKLHQWKLHKGLNGELVTIESIGATVVDLKKFIRQRKSVRPGLRYVILLGDVSLIPSEDIPASAFGPNITDYYYSTPKDPAPGSDEFVFPWLSVGRIPVATEAAAIDAVDKIIEYEKNPPTDPAYYKRAVSVAYFQDNNSPGEAGFGTDDRAYLKTMEEIRTFLVSIGFQVDRIYVSNNAHPKYYIDGTPIPNDVLASFVDYTTATSRIISAVNQGRVIIAHRDHGEENGWAYPPFKINHLAQVSTTVPSVFFSINCLTGCFDNSTDSFAEKLLATKGTAPSLIAATRVSHTWLNDSLMKALFDSIFGGMIPTFPGSTNNYPVKNGRLGDMLNYAKTYLPISNSGGASYIKDHAEIYHVIGDPTLEVWKAAPRLIKMNLKLYRSYLDISLSECPVGSVITLWSNGRLLKTITPGVTHMHISLMGLIAIPEFMSKTPTLTACFSAPGFRYVEKKAQRAGIVVNPGTMVE